MSISESMNVMPPGSSSKKRTSDQNYPEGPRKMSTSSLCDSFTRLNNPKDRAKNLSNSPKPMKTPTYQAPQNYRAHPSYASRPDARKQASSTTKNPTRTLESDVRGIHNLPLENAPNQYTPARKPPSPPKNYQTSETPNNQHHSISQFLGPPPYPPVQPDYIYELPTNIRPYVEQIINVKGDGHCGFRAVAYCLGQGEGNFIHIRQKVVEELRKNRNYYMRQDPNMNVEETINISNLTDPQPCGVANWMSMPSFGRPMANAFNTAVFFYSETWSESFFPDFSQPNSNPPIIFALIPSARHFVAITFKEPSLFPAPRPVGTHGRPFSGAHGAWQAKYSRCIALYNSLNP
jgi:hypothetical protein